MKVLHILTSLAATGAAFASVMLAARQSSCDSIGEICQLHNNTECCTGLRCKDYNGLGVCSFTT